MATIVGIASNKGGSGKSTIALNLSHALATRKKRVLLIDGDPQQTISTLFQYKHRARHGLTNMILTCEAKDSITTTTFPNIDIVVNDDPGGEASGVISNFLRRSANNHAFLTLGCQSIADDYDFIIIDTLGAIGTFQESVVYASDVVITPVVPNYVDVTELVSGVLPRYRDLLPIRPGMLTVAGKEFPRVAILINQLQKNLVDHAKILNFIRTEFLENTDKDFGRLRLSVLPTVIAKRAVFNTAQGMGESAEKLDRKGSPSATEMMEGLIHDLFTGTNAALSLVAKR